ncbi:hypothetical protein [Mycobacterium neumannii]|uniref:hypothetical protein n=1 Tax=Mycobacterium neumannii TaxID=2048551 RepID=UPI003AB265A3
MPQSNAALQPKPMRLSALDLDLAPDAPGIYAWYAQLALGNQDWERSDRDGVDAAIGYLINAISDYARVHQPIAIHLKGEASYNLHWSGRLERASIADGSPLSATSDVKARMEGLADQPVVRRLLISLLRAATPMFASPLYIGVATNLRVRLGQHMAAYENARASLRRRSSTMTVQEEDDSFGARLASTGMPLEYLECYVLPADLAEVAVEDSGTTLSARDVAAAAEWILQRIFLPVLGRQ